MPVYDQANELRSELAALQSTAANFGIRFIPDAKVRLEYNMKAQQLSSEILAEVKAGRLSIASAAARASELRNVLMDAMRGQTSEIARAYAVKHKALGKTLPELQEKYARKLFYAGFSELAEQQRNRVWREIVFSSGRPQAKANQLAKVLGSAGRGFIALTLVVSAYHLYAADNKAKAVAAEGAVLGGGLLGSLAGGAAGGLACGPGAPVCVAIGVFVGGVMFAVGSQIAFDSFWMLQ